MFLCICGIIKSFDLEEAFKGALELVLDGFGACSWFCRLLAVNVSEENLLPNLIEVFN